MCVGGYQLVTPGGGGGGGHIHGDELTAGVIRDNEMGMEGRGRDGRGIYVALWFMSFGLMSLSGLCRLG